MLDVKAHWERVHAENEPADVSWTQEEPRLSLRLLADAGVTPEARIVDVGCGATGLASRLARDGWTHVTGVDVSGAAIARARELLGPLGDAVAWIESDASDLHAGPFDAWHDRATYHFLTEAGDRARYKEALRRCTKPGAAVVVAGFAPDGPEACSGLPVMRGDPEDIARSLGLRLLKGAREEHVTPWGATQRFGWALMRRD